MHPMVHLNGSSKKDLLKQASDVYCACTDLLEKMAQATPNGRDYYPISDSALSKAREEHQEFVLQVRKLQDFMMERMEYLADLL